MHSYLRAVGFSKVRSREEIKEIIGDTVRNYDEKIAVEGHPDGIFTEFSKNYGCDCGITAVSYTHLIQRGAREYLCFNIEMK